MTGLATPPMAGEEEMKHFAIHEDNKDTRLPVSDHDGSQGSKHTISSNDVHEGSTVPLVSTKLGNIGNSRSSSASKKLKVHHPVTGRDVGESAMDTLLAKLSAQQQVAMGELQKISAASAEKRSSPAIEDDAAKNTGTPKIPATKTPDMKSIGGISSIGPRAPLEVERLKQELTAAKDRLSKQEQELTNTRAIHSVLDQPTLGSKVENMAKSVNVLQETYNPGRPGAVFTNEDTKSDISDSITGGVSLNRGMNIWDNNPSTSSSSCSINAGPNIWTHGSRPPWMNRPSAPALPPLMVPPQQPIRSYSGSTSPVFGTMPQYFGDINQYQYGNGFRRYTNQSSRSGSSFNPTRSNGWSPYGSSGEISPITNISPASYQPMGLFQAPHGYQPRPIGTPLSPTATEFTSGNGNVPWGATHSSSSSQTYIPPMEPLNYRKLLDRNVSCNWKYIVDKIVCNNDQQASIFLQQKLKVGTAEQKYSIVEAIVAQAYPLMVNRFGNFLVQRCFEHGTPEQVVAIANAIRGNTLSLSMDAFGCHVVQKAFDAVPEEYKAIMVHELLRRIPETVIHRYACHVWQKLFELRWSDSPPQIMKYVNEALRGMWHEVALGETGSLVVQNIFENCLEEDKRPCISEVLNSIDIVAHGQFGNWCIQHICEHGAPTDRSRAVDHVLRYATEYSMDQFASKVVEKCLKIGGGEFLERYLERVCEGRSDRPRIPLIDIASDQYGNYLVQYILTHAGAQHRELVASHIRKHMVSLRGSKFGSRVGLLCCNPAYATRPGPAIPAPTNRFNNVINAPSARYGGQFR